MTDSIAGALFSQDRTRRYVLWRVWDTSKKTALCVGLNPSTANEHKNDRTIDFLIKVLRDHNYGELKMVNLFTQVTPYPKELSPNGSEFDIDIIKKYALLSQEVILCWGTFKEAQERGRQVAALFPDALCFGVNMDGSPRHPAWFVRNGVKLELVTLEKYRL